MQNTNETEFWVSAQGTGGDGSLYNPFRAATTSALGQLFTQETRENVTWHFLPGAYRVPSTGIIPRTRWKFRGSGRDNTTLRVDHTASNIYSAAFINWSRTDGVEISDLTIDCNGAAHTQAGWAAGVRVIGSFITLSRLKVVNWMANSAECFVVAIGNDQINRNYNPVIEDVIVTQPAQVVFGDGVTAISIHADGPGLTGLVTGGVIRNCLVYGVTTGAGAGQPVYFHAYSDGTGGATRNNFAYDLLGDMAVAVYRDSWNGKAEVIDGNVFRNVKRGIFFNAPSFHVSGVSIRQNVIEVAQDGFGIEYYRGAGPPGTSYGENIVLNGNVVTPYTGTTVCTAVSMDTGKRVTVQGNVMQGIGGGSDYVTTGTDTLRANANLTGPIADVP